MASGPKAQVDVPDMRILLNDSYHTSAHLLYHQIHITCTEKRGGDGETLT